jgi:DNA-binding LacI/PurR family transcriptional regulator
MSALGAMRSIRLRGLRIPEDISVAGFDDLFIAAYTEPPLTTVRQPMRRMGQMAMEHLLMLISGAETVVKIKVQSELIVRQSTAGVKIPPARNSQTLRDHRELTAGKRL